ncbi:MAG: site-2 protease family protein [Planctomycetes bacterium]|nr:site-2 protease family protein [Planctomycetota bacterium]
MVSDSLAVSRGLSFRDTVKPQLVTREEMAEYIRSVINGDEQDLELLVRRLDGKEVWISVRPSRLVSQIKGANYAKIGMRSTGIPTLLDELPVIPYSSAGLAKAFKGNDVIVAINGKPVKHLYEVNRILTQRSDETLTFTVERKEKEGSTPTKLDIEVAPVRLMRLGVHMKIGCITAVQVNSPAEGKLLPGDLIETVNGEPVGDPFTLGDRLRKLAGQEVVFGIRRNESESTQTIQSVKVTPRQPTILPEHRTADPIAIDEIGVAFRVLNWVVHVEPGSPAGVARNTLTGKVSGIKRGDKIVKLEFVATEKEKKEYEEVGVTLKPIDLKEENIEWPMVHEYLQDLTSTTKVKLTLLRNGQIRKVDLAWDKNSTWFTEKTHYRPARGFLWQRKTDIHEAGSFGEAFGLGWRQTKEDATRVFRFLQKLIRGEISATNLGGPGTIAVVATSEAMQGTPRLLLFLTLLSANLAIVNFLPIPVLDGGHMMFLLYEGIRGKPPNEKVFMGLTLIGFAFILGLMLFVVGLDIFRFSNW